MSPDIHEETLAPATRQVFEKLAECPWTSDFYLAGGTALAMRLGHRVSVDLDFFSGMDFNESQLVERLRETGKLLVFQKAPQSFTGALDGVKLSFLGYKYPTLKEGDGWRGIVIASLQDIACMKLDALSSRGTKRDFVDMFFIAKLIPLPTLLNLFQEKYASVNYNILHVKKSQAYFEEAEGESMPAMLMPADWQEVKRFFVTQAQML